MNYEPMPSYLTEEWLNEVCAINKKYDCSSRVVRSEQDEIRSKELWNKIWAYNDLWNIFHPIPPCPECGGVRLATTKGICLNIGDCSLAPHGIGG